jgi:succinate dehydrogenase / fumarate reductase membrane anchor subunit
MMLRSPLGRVRGLGSAKEGVAHWWAQRVTALALIPLTIWFVASVIALAGADYAAVVAWLRSPVVAALLVLLLFATFYHAALGLQVVIEDYVHEEGAKLAAILIVKALCLLLGLAGVLAVLKIAFGGL